MTDKEQLKKYKSKLVKLKKRIKNLKQKILDEENLAKFTEYDEFMTKYYSHVLPDTSGDDLTDLYNYWGNKADENKMRALFEGSDMDRYRDYDVAELLFEDSAGRTWLTDRKVSEDTFNKLAVWYTEDYDSPTFKSIDDIPVAEQEAVLEFIRLFYNITVSSCICDW